MGDLNASVYFVGPAYAVTIVTFAILAGATYRRLRIWRTRAREQEEEAVARTGAPNDQRTD